jgi:hypothetical protein
VITVAVSSPDSCDLAVDGPTSVGLPATGFFATTTGTNPYSLLQGNWLLETAPTGTNECIPGLDCTGGAAASNGSLTLNCATWQCETSGEDQETSRKSGPPCVAHLTVYDGDAAAYNSTPDSSTSSKGDAGGDATATTPSSDGGAG